MVRCWAEEHIRSEADSKARLKSVRSKCSFDNASIHSQCHTVDIGRSRRNQKHSRICKFLRGANASQRDLGSLPGSFFLNRRMVVLRAKTHKVNDALGLRPTGQDGIKTNILLP